jgi:branched-chain amino acid transport system permease protein
MTMSTIGPSTGPSTGQTKWQGLLFWLGAVAFLAGLFAATLVVGNEYPFFAGYVILQFIVLAVAWSVLGGNAGYVNFGTAAFVGVGVYTAIFLFKATGAPLLVQIAVAGLVGALLGLGIGVLTLRMQGIFFSIATIAITIIIETVITNWKFVGGAAGIQLERPPVLQPFDSYVKMLFIVQAVLVVIAVAVARYIQNSWIGRGLKALKDDELAAECTGVPTLRLKLLACAISGALMCAAGAPSAMYLQYAQPTTAFDLNYSVSALAMALIGGTSHWIGPVFGAILLGVTQQWLTVNISSEVNVLVLGLMLVLFVVIAPHGIVGLLRRLTGKGASL